MQFCHIQQLIINQLIVEHIHLQDGPQLTQQSQIRYYKYLHYFTDHHEYYISCYYGYWSTFGNQLNKKMDLHNN